MFADFHGVNLPIMANLFKYKLMSLKAELGRAAQQPTLIQHSHYSLDAIDENNLKSSHRLYLLLYTLGPRTVADSDFLLNKMNKNYFICLNT